MPRPRLPRMAAGRPASGDVLLALVSYVPLLLTRPGMLGADTKAYLYLDPGKLLRKAPYLWDPSVGLGTVTHQNIGYLFPMGPYYWLMEVLRVPDWIAQRLWFGSIIFLAGIGMRYLLRTLRWEGPGATVAAFAYALSPYLLHYIYKHSVILLPFTALPWLVAFTARALRQGGWRHPALFALVALAAGGINATSLILVMIGPGLWVLHAVFVDRELTFREAIPPVLRIALLGAATSLWWVAGLMLQGSYGIDVLRFTETYRTVSDASTSAEVGRSLGYWFFYGIDTFGPWFKAAETMTQSIPALAVSFAVPIVAVACALWTRFRYRVFFVGCAVVGLVVAVGAHPWDGPSPYGSVFKAFAAEGPGLALRSTPRAIPLLALSLAVFLGAGVAAAAQRFPARRLVFASLALALVCANMSPLFTGRMIDPFLERPNDVPDYWHEVGEYLDAGVRRTRALEVPGIEFANYRWGASVDPITPGLTNRSYAARELVPYGSEASANLMNAIDTPLQDRSFDPSSLSPILRLLGAGDLIVRNDLQFERFRTPRPRPMERWMTTTPGLGEPEQFGTDEPNVATPVSPLLDDLELSIPDTDPDPHAVSVYPVDDPLPILRTVPEGYPTIIAGDGTGIVTTAEAGLLRPDALTVYSGTISGDDAGLDRLLDADARLVITDTNRKAGRRWGTTKDNDGFTEMADEDAPDDPSDNRLDLFGGRGPDVQTVAVQDGPITATASGYGNALSFTPGDRASNAIDGTTDTAWRVGAFADVRGEWLELRLRRAAAPGTITLQQPGPAANRTITKVRLTFDGKDPLVVDLDESSHDTPVTVDVGDRRFSTVRFTVLDTDAGRKDSYKGLSGVGFSEVAVGDLGPTTEVIRPPVDLLEAAGDRAADLDVSFVLRRRTAPADSGALDEETRLVRQLDLPSDRAFTVSGKLRLDPDATDDEVDRLLGVGGAAMTSSSGLVGDARSRASKAFDGDDTTSWQSNLEPDPNQWIQMTTTAPVTTTISSVSVLADGRHSVPTRIHLEVDGVAQPSIELPAARDGERGTVRMLRFDPVTLTGSNFRVVVEGVRDVSAPNWYTNRPTRLPISITEVDAPELAAQVAPVDVGLSECRNDLLSVNGTPIAVRTELVAEAAATAPEDIDAAERGELVPFATCDPAAAVALEAGGNRVETQPGAATNLDIDQLLLTSGESAAPASEREAPDLRSSTSDPVHYTARAESSQRPYWLVLGQSDNTGWQLTANGIDLGESTLVNGYANGWYVDPAEVGESPRFELRWTPQRQVWIALLISAVGFVACLALAIRPAPAVRRGLGRQKMEPVAIRWFDAFGRAPDTWPTILATGAALLGGVVFVGPVWGLPTAAAMLWALRTDLGWRVLRLAVIAALGLAAAYVTVAQWHRQYPLDFDWPQYFDAVHRLGMFAYALLAVECVVEVLRGGWRRNAGLDDDL